MQVGQKAVGEYVGVQFSGVITEYRSLTVKTDGAFEVCVDLDTPIEVFGTQRNKLMTYVKFDGSPSTYTKLQDWMKLQ